MMSTAASPSLWLSDPWIEWVYSFLSASFRVFRGLLPYPRHPRYPWSNPKPNLDFVVVVFERGYRRYRGSRPG